jgi:hypothetical protein
MNHFGVSVSSVTRTHLKGASPCEKKASQLDESTGVTKTLPVE